MRTSPQDRNKRMWLALGVLGLLWVPHGVQGQENPRFNADFHRPSVHPGDILGVMTSTEPEHLAWSAGLWFTLNNKPLAIIDSATGNKIWGAVTNQFVLDLYGSLALFDILDVGLDVPLFLASAGDSPSPGMTFAHASGFSLGDLRLGIKGTFLGGRGRGFGLALAEDLTFPTATKRNFSGDESLTSTTNLIADFTSRGWAVALNAGFRARKAAWIGNYKISHELLLGLGLNVPILCNRLEAFGTMEARTQVSDPFADKYGRSLDLMGGLRGRIGPVLLAAAGGGGLLQGYGSPAYRVTVQIAYEGQPVEKGCVEDSDEDGVPDEADRCPTEPGPEALQGCPDRDQDGIADVNDTCPDTPGVEAFQGCPDSDGDGIEDSKDRCPQKAGVIATGGCPDSDGDGIADDDDECPDLAGLSALKGCPDRDRDGVADAKDRCPDVPGTAELDGCPPEPSRVKVTAERIEIREVVLFETGKATIKPESFGLLDDVAKVLNTHTNIRKVRVEGHTDNVGNKKKNLKLSGDRAKAVMTYLIHRGVAPERLVFEGYGDTRPIADNKTAEGRAKNRRVEFVILERE